MLRIEGNLSLEGQEMCRVSLWESCLLLAKSRLDNLFGFTLSSSPWSLILAENRLDNLLGFSLDARLWFPIFTSFNLWFCKLLTYPVSQQASRVSD